MVEAVQGELLMKPPEKIFLSQQWSIPSRREWTWSVSEKKRNIDVTEYEYHLAPQWVSVEDRLPEDSGYYLTFEIDSNLYIVYYNEDEGCLLASDTTHWMPLPAPPEDRDDL